MDQAVESWQSAEDVENSVDYQAMLVAASGKPERSMGTSTIPAEPPQWKEVLKLASSLRSKQPQHAGVLTYMVKAQSGLHGFVGLRSSMEELLDAFTTDWHGVLPLADEDVPEDPYYGRTNYLRELSEQPLFLSQLYLFPLVSVRAIGQYSARDIDISAGNIQGDEDEKARCQNGLIKAAFEQADPVSLSETAESFEAAKLAVQGLENLFAKNAGGTEQLVLDGLKKRITECQSKFMDFAEDLLVVRAENPPETEAIENHTAEQAVLANAAISAPAALSSTSLGIDSRQAASDALAMVIRYYQEFEPSSPVVVLAHRAREMIPQSYFELLQQLAPEHKASFPELMSALQKDPLAYLLGDSYQRFVNGELIPCLLEADEHPMQAARKSSQAIGTTSNAVSRSDEDAPAHGQIDASDSSTKVHQTPDETPDQVQGNPADTVDHPGDDKSVKASSRKDVVAILTGVEQYFKASEPSSPIPLIMQTINKLVAKSFSELIVQFSDSKAETSHEAEQG